jgi:hypothetical protein
MEKLKKLFPLSFKHCTSVKGLILTVFLYLLLNFGASLVLELVVYPLISSALYLLLSPLWLIFWIIGLVILVAGIALTIYIVGIPLIYIGMIIMLIPTIIVSWLCSFLTSFLTIYIIAGCVISILAYGGVFGEIPEKEPKKEKDIQ